MNADKTKYMSMSRDQNAGRSHNIKIDNGFFEMVEQFQYLGTTSPNRNSSQDEIRSRLLSCRAESFCLPVCCPKI